MNQQDRTVRLSVLLQNVSTVVTTTAVTNGSLAILSSVSTCKFSINNVIVDVDLRFKSSFIWVNTSWEDT